MRLAPASLARQLLLQLAVAAMVTAAAVALAYCDARRDSLHLARTQVVNVAQAVAHEPTIRNALTTTDPAPLLQPLAASVQRATGVDFGRGLGRAFVRATVDRHGRSIEVRRADRDVAAHPAGAVLTVRLPLPAATPA